MTVPPTAKPDLPLQLARRVRRGRRVGGGLDVERRSGRDSCVRDEAFDVALRRREAVERSGWRGALHEHLQEGGVCGIRQEAAHTRRRRWMWPSARLSFC